MVRLGEFLFATSVSRDSVTGQRWIQIVELGSESVIVAGHKFKDDTRPNVKLYVDSMMTKFEEWLAENAIQPESFDGFCEALAKTLEHEMERVIAARV